MPKIMKSLNNISRSQALFRTESLLRQGITDVSSCHYTLLLSICREPGRSQEEIAHDICLNKSTVARAITQLEDHGYVSRSPKAEDKRCLLVYPTDKTLTLLPVLRSIGTEWNEYIVDGILDEELEVFHSVLLRMEKNAKQANAQGGARS